MSTAFVRDVPCPVCHAQAGMPCTRNAKSAWRRLTFHPGRVDVARGDNSMRAAGLGPLSPLRVETLRCFVVAGEALTPAEACPHLHAPTQFQSVYSLVRRGLLEWTMLGLARATPLGVATLNAIDVGASRSQAGVISGDGAPACS